MPILRLAPFPLPFFAFDACSSFSLAVWAASTFFLMFLRAGAETVKIVKLLHGCSKPSIIRGITYGPHKAF